MAASEGASTLPGNLLGGRAIGGEARCRLAWGLGPRCASPTILPSLPERCAGRNTAQVAGPRSLSPDGWGGLGRLLPRVRIPPSAGG